MVDKDVRELRELDTLTFLGRYMKKIAKDMGVFGTLSKAVNYFPKKPPSLMFERFLNTPLRETASSMSSFKRIVTVSGDLMFLESFGNSDVANTVTVLL